MVEEFYVQQNSFHMTSKYLEILTIWHFKIVVPRPGSHHHKKKKKPNRQFSETCPTKPPNVYVHQLSWYLLTPRLLLNPDITEEEPADEGDIQVKYSSHQLYSLNTAAVTKGTI
jgi:hypothetical protein